MVVRYYRLRRSGRGLGHRGNTPRKGISYGINPNIYRRHKSILSRTRRLRIPAVTRSNVRLRSFGDNSVHLVYTGSNLRRRKRPITRRVRLLHRLGRGRRYIPRR